MLTPSLTRSQRTVTLLSPSLLASHRLALALLLSAGLGVGPLSALPSWAQATLLLNAETGAVMATEAAAAEEAGNAGVLVPAMEADVLGEPAAQALRTLPQSPSLKLKPQPDVKDASLINGQPPLAISSQYPVLDELELAVYGVVYPEDLSLRLHRLESVFRHNPSAQASYQSRMDWLQNQRLAEHPLTQTQPLVPIIEGWEQRLWGKTFVALPLPDRFSQLEERVLSFNFKGEPLRLRYERLAKRLPVHRSL